MEHRDDASQTDSSRPIVSHAIDAGRAKANSARAFDALLDQYREMADSTRMRGNYFEQLIAQYLKSDSQMKSQFSDVYLWKDWPGRSNKPDCGIDLVAIPADDPHGAVAIQCKFHSEDGRINKSDLDSFLAESGKTPFTRRIFVETTGAPWSANAEDAISEQQIPVTRIGLTDLRNSDIDWTSYQLADPSADVSLQERKQLRDHQVTAIDKILTGFETSDRGTLVMACGTGKTFTSLKLAEQIAEDEGGAARILFLVPSLALMSQTLEEWSAESELPFHAWSVCSDIKVNRKRAERDDITDLAVTDLKIPATTNHVKLAESLDRHNNSDGLQVVFATYQSIDVIHLAQEIAGGTWRDFDLVICDEAHRTTGVTLAGEDESHFVRIHDADYIRASRRLYMTATPRIFQPQVKNAATERDAVLCSMDDREIYGPVFYRLGFGEAVSCGLLTDYKVVVLAVPEDEASSTYQAHTAQDGELNLPETAKLIGCWNALAKRKGGVADVKYGEDLTPMHRAVAFAKDIKTSKWVANEFSDLVATHLQDLSNDDPTDDLEVQCRHVDGTMNAIQRGNELDWLKADSDSDHPVCRILTNARCLSEGVDVPTLDAVLFLNPRRSQVDVIQAVGRVMRKAEDKEFGYIVLPVAVPMGLSPEEALNDNRRYQVIWQVLQAIRAHDERLDATINSIEYNHEDPQNIIVDVVSLTPPRTDDSDHFDGEATDPDATSQTNDSANVPAVQTVLQFPVEDWKDAVYSRIVKRCGNRLYWDDWSKDIADIAGRYIGLIERLLEDPEHQDDFAVFVDALQQTLNPAIDNAQAVEMLAQHIITKPLFDAMFEDQQFTEQNPVSRAMQGILNRLAGNAVFEKERQPLEAFYTTMVDRIRAIDNVAGKQEIMVTLYEKFFKTAFPQLSDRLGIVFTPVEVVDFILRSTNDALSIAFEKSLGDRGVALVEPFLGTGTFITRLLQSGLIPTENLRYKYENEIFANEIVLLSYYIASINIEAVYREVLRENSEATGIGREQSGEYSEFKGIALTDTFHMHESDDKIGDAGVFEANIERVSRQKAADITAIVMNPPYSVGQSSANDNNQNLKYPRLDERIETTYARRSTATNKNSLYDSYYRALRWATDRIGEAGVIAFISNSAFIDGNTADGVRLTWQDEFSDIFIYNLKGNARTQGERRRQEAGNVFKEGSRAGIAIAVLVKRKDHAGPAHIHYAEVGDYLARQEKLNEIAQFGSIAGIAKAGRFETITPNKHGDWINQRDDRFTTWQPIGDRKTKGKEQTPGVFRQYSRGLATARDAWCYGFSAESVARNMRRMIENYNAEVNSARTKQSATRDSTRISWNRQLYRDLENGRYHEFHTDAVIPSMYRPFMRQRAYFRREMNDMIYQLPQIFPTERHVNIAVSLPVSGNKAFTPFIVDRLLDIQLNSNGQIFPLYTWEKLPDSETGGPASLFDDFERGGYSRKQFDERPEFVAV